MRTLVTGLGLLESPRWHGGRLYFSDWTAGEIRALDTEGRTEVVVRHESLPLCFDFTPDGVMLVVSSATRTLLRCDGGTEPEHLADLSPLSTIVANDIVIDGRGNAFVNSNDAEFGATAPEGGPATGRIALVTPGGEVRVVADDLDFPNGMAVTPDNATLVVAESYRHRLTAFPISADGSLGQRRVFADLGDGTPDGICLDAEGAAWYADVPNRRCVRVRDGGQVMEQVDLPRGGFACMLGGADGRTLFAVGATWPGAAAFGAAEGAEPPQWHGTVWSTPAPAAAAGWPGN